MEASFHNSVTEPKDEERQPREDVPINSELHAEEEDSSFGDARRRKVTTIIVVISAVIISLAVMSVLYVLSNTTVGIERFRALSTSCNSIVLGEAKMDDIARIVGESPSSIDTDDDGAISKIIFTIGDTKDADAIGMTVTVSSEYDTYKHYYNSGYMRSSMRSNEKEFAHSVSIECSDALLELWSALNEPDTAAATTNLTEAPLSDIVSYLGEDPVMTKRIISPEASSGSSDSPVEHGNDDSRFSYDIDLVFPFSDGRLIKATNRGGGMVVVDAYDAATVSDGLFSVIR